MTTVRLKGGRVIDPTHNVDGEVRDVVFRDGRIVDLPAHETVDQVIDVSGCLVMAGGIDMHSHIGGGKVNLARLMLPEDHRVYRTPQQWLEQMSTSSGEPPLLASCGCCAPGTLATGYRYVEMGYTAAFEPALVFANARQAHLEMGDVPIIDHGAYVVLGNEDLLLRWLGEGAGPERVRDYVGWAMNASRALGVKIVNAGGISAFKYNQRKLDVDERHPHYNVTPRQVVHALARAVKELGVPHAVHIHSSNLGVPGNIDSTLATIDALEGLPGHLTHIQFHSYGTEGPKKFSSAALRLAEAVNKNANVSVDVGQIMFGQTVTASGDTMRQYANAGVGNPRKWVVADIECDAGCGVVPFRYREQSFVNALQWAIGLELFLLVRDPWRIVLSTDHPNGAPFTTYPHLIKLLMNKSFRDEQFAKLHPDAVALSSLKEIKRELSLYEIAIMTRSGPARLLGLKDRGHLGAGAAADITVYRENGDVEAMFTTPGWVFKDGKLVARDGRLVATPVGGVHFVEPDYDRAIERNIADFVRRHGSVNPGHVPIGRDELCACTNGGRLLPCEVHQAAAA